MDVGGGVVEGKNESCWRTCLHPRNTAGNAVQAKHPLISRFREHTPAPHPRATHPSRAQHQQYAGAPPHCAHASPLTWCPAPRLPQKPARPPPLTLQRSHPPRACVSRPSICVFEQCPATPIVVSRPGLVRRHLVHRALGKILNCGKAPTLTRLK